MTTHDDQARHRPGRGSVHKRCGCCDNGGRRRGASCPDLVVAGHGSWYWTTDLRRGADGRRRRRRRGGHATRHAAADALERQHGAPAPDATAPLTTGCWLQAWLESRVDLRPSTRRMYASHLACYLLPQLGQIPLAELSPVQIRRMVDVIGADHERTGRPLKPATLVRMRAALNAAVREQLLAGNPLRHVALPPRRRPHPQVWTDARVQAWAAGGARPAVAVWTAEQTARFLSAARPDPLYPLLHLLAVRGLRRGEAAGLTWHAVDLPRATLEVSQQVVEVGGRLVLGPPKSAASCRTLALDADSLTLLTDLHAARQPDPGDYVVANAAGGPIRPKRLSAAVRRIVADAGLPPVRLHDLLHGAASLTLAARADLKVIQDLLGHSSIVLTVDTDTSVLPDVGRAAADGVAALIREAGTRAPGRAAAPLDR